ncbi:MAG TPA: PPOX class F420-dependent oxidoreductase [Streptosporangiaceae bacterium]|nr:PPOX class F420-dependent oxidoreductase [Streptosporangiaceae bacterium]
MVFTAGEIAYIGAQRLGRLATVQPSGDPQVNPVSCYYNPDTGTIDIGGRAMAVSRKYRNVSRNPRVAVVIDDMAAGPPPRIRCLEIRGRAEALPEPDHTTARTAGPIIRVHPERVISWGIDPPGLALGSRNVQSGGLEDG